MIVATGLILWFLRASNAWAITSPWGTIYVVPEQFSNQRLLRHEQIHLEQLDRDGAIKWTLKILWYLLRYGYKNSPYEVEARIKSGF